MPTVIRIAADPSKGFNWAYYLSIPDEFRTNAPILVEPNNSAGPSVSLAEDDRLAFLTVTERGRDFADLGVPVLVPTFTRPLNPDHIYTQSLNRETLALTSGDLARVDLQLIAMIRDAQASLRGAGNTIDDQILMNGFSAGGMFTSRFAALHPALVKAAAIGAPGGWPIVPVERYNGELLPFPVGIGDLAAVSGITFDEAAYRSIAQLIYVGSADSNDAVPHDGFDAGRDLIYRYFRGDGAFPALGWPAAESLFDQNAASARFLVDPGVGHTNANFTALGRDFFASILQSRYGEVTGDASSQVIEGTSDKARPDLVRAGAGADTVMARAGNDIVFGETGDDSLFGGTGSDTLHGGDGNDLLFGSRENANSSGLVDPVGDTLFGDAGRDVFEGGQGNDTINGGTGTDTASFSGLRSSYAIAYDSATAMYSVTGADGTDQLKSIEVLTFADGQIGIEQAAGLDGVVHRFFNGVTGAHFYTASNAEADAVRAQLPTFDHEGLAYRVAALGASGAVDVFRFFNVTTQFHFYTASPEERDAIIRTLHQFSYEGVAYQAYGADAGAREELYRFFNSATAAHFYTPDEAERDAIIATLPTFAFEGIAYYVDLV